MKVSREKLAAQAQLTGYRSEFLEKVAQLLHVLAALNPAASVDPRHGGVVLLPHLGRNQPTAV